MCLSLSASGTRTLTAVCCWTDEADFGKDGGANRLNISWSLKVLPELLGELWSWTWGLSDSKNTDKFFFNFFFETRCLCSPSWPQIVTWSKMTLNIWFSCLYLQSAGVTGPHYHTLFFVVLGNWSFLYSRQALHQLNYIPSQINIFWVSFALTIQWSNWQ